MALVREYAQRNSEEAFTKLVSRHVNLAYSVALRQVRDPHLAEEITQSVFLILARKAKSLSPSTILSGWVCRTTRYVSADALKIQRRRQFREQESQMQSISNESDSAAWEQIAPLLDDALACLRKKEHDAVVLRYFEEKELRQVGVAMGIGEDAARMRVNRGVEKLRRFFIKRGVTLSSTAIAAAVAGSSIQAAPPGLAAAISAAALSGGTVTTAAVILTAKTIAMTTLQKTVITIAFGVAVGAGIYEARQAAKARVETQTLEQGQAPLHVKIEQLRGELNEATNRLVAMANSLAKGSNNGRELLALRSEVTRLRRQSQEPRPLGASGAGGTAGLADKSWLDRVGRLRQRLEQTPEAQIPELKFLTDADWLEAASRKLDTDDDYRAAFEELRARGEGHFLQTAEPALRKYLESHHDEFPVDLSQLTPYFETPPADEILSRYQVVPSSTVPQVGGLGETNGWLITLKSPDSEALLALGKTGVGGSSAQDSQEMSVLAPAMKALFDATPVINGKKSAKLEDLAPYLTTPEQTAAYQKMMQRRAAAAK